MGKVKRQAQKHSNHHDNPRRGNTSISRRQHSQKPTPAVRKVTSQPASRGNPQGQSKKPFAKFDNVLLVGEGMIDFVLPRTRNFSCLSLSTTAAC